MKLTPNIKASVIAALAIFQLDSKVTSGMHPGIMINRTKAVPLYLETLKKQVEEDNIGKFSLNNDNDQSNKNNKTINQKYDNQPRSYKQSQDIISKSKLALLFNVVKTELSDFSISTLDEEKFYIETKLKEIPIANIKRKIIISISQNKETSINVEIYDENSTRQKQEEKKLKERIMQKYNKTLNDMKI